MGWPLLARCIVVGACLAGCAAIAGINDGNDTSDVADDAGFADRANAHEIGTGPDGAPCVPKSAPLPTGPVHAKRAAIPPTLDGVFDDWACVDRIDVGKGAGESQMPTGVAQSVEFAIQWTPNDVYFYAHAVTAAPGLDNGGNQIFRNDSVHLFIGRDPLDPTSPLYRTGDHQITIDYNDHVGDYLNGSLIGTKTEARVKIATLDGSKIDFEIEARIPVASLGFAAGMNLTSAEKLVVNLMLVDGKTAGANGTYGFRVWRLPPIAQCPCVTGCCDRLNGTQDIPTCDFRCTNSMVLDE